MTPMHHALPTGRFPGAQKNIMDIRIPIITHVSTSLRHGQVPETISRTACFLLLKDHVVLEPIGATS